MKKLFLVGIFILITLYSFSAEVIRYVDPDATGGSTGLDWTNAYTSLFVWEAAEQTDLVTDGDWHHVYCRASSGTADTTVLTISGWTTDAIHNIVIEAASGDEALKTGWDATRFRLVVNSSFVIGSGEGYINIIGLQLENTSSNGGDAVFFENVAGDFVLQNNYIHSTGAASGIHAGNSSANYIVENNIIVNVSSSAGSEGIFLDAVNSSLIYNNVIEGWEDGIEVDEGTNIFKNNAVFNNTDDFNDDGGTNTYDYNASDDGDGTNPQAPSGADWANEFNNVTGGDFTLLTGGNLKDNGIGPGSDTNVPTTDMDGTARSGATCDIGVDEYVSAPPSGIAVLRRRILGYTMIFTNFLSLFLLGVVSYKLKQARRKLLWYSEPENIKNLAIVENYLEEFHA